MYEGSLYGKGALVFAVWGFVIAMQVRDATYGMVVTLNPAKLADTIGEDEEQIRKAIEFLCSPDPDSTSKEEHGRRLIQVAEREYQVVNGAKYQAMRNEEMRRDYMRDYMRKKRSKPLPGEATDQRLERLGTSQADRDKVQDSTLPLLTKM